MLRNLIFLLLVWTSAQTLWAQHSDWEALQAELEMATQAYSYGDLEGSIPVFERYMEAAKERDAHHAYLEALIYRAHAYAYQGAPKKGYDLLAEGGAYQHQHLPHDTAWQIKMAYMEGQIATLAGEHLRGLAALQQADQWLEQMDSTDYELSAAISQNIGFIYDELGDRAASVAYLQAAVDYFLQHENRDVGYLHMYYNFLANALAGMGDLGRAELYLDEAMRIVRENDYIPDFYLNSALIQKGDLYYDADEFEVAAGYYQQALLAIRAQPQINASDSAHAHNGLGNAYIKLSQYERALFHQQQAVSCAEQDQGQVFIQLPSFYHNLADAYEALGQDGKRYETLLTSQAFVEAHLPPHHRHRTDVYTALGQYHVDKEDWQAGMRFFQKALYAAGAEVDTLDAQAIPESLPVEFGPSMLPPLSKKILAHHMRYLDAGELEDLYAARSLRILGEQALTKMQQGIQPGWGRRVLRGRMSLFYENALAATLALAEATHDAQYLTEAFQLAEAASARLLSLALQDSRAKSYAGVAPELLEEERRIKRQLAALKMQVEREATDSLQQRVFDTRQRLDSLILVMETQYPRYHALKYRVPSPELSSLQEILSHEQAVCVRYFWGTEQVYTFVIHPDSLAYFSSPTDTLLTLLTDIRTQLRDKTQAQERARSQEVYEAFCGPAFRLYQHLLAPVEPLMASQAALLIVPDGPLSYLPFEILLTEPASGGAIDYSTLPYLFARQEVRYLYASQLLLDEASTFSGASYGGFAPSYSASEALAQYRSLYPNLGALQGNTQEVASISQLMEGSAYLGQDATEPIFRSQANQFGLLHLSMHTLFNNSDPMYSGLVFSPEPEDWQGSDPDRDGILHAYELYTLELKAQLAVLSACQTGDGAWQRGEGVASLARAFRYAGCPNVVMSLWEVDDEATQVLMGHFFRHLKAGLSRPVALQQARTDFLGETDKQHPHFWASFVYMGDGNPLQEERSLWPFGVTGALFGLIVVMLLQRRKRKQALSE